jgi:hypothetical protein
MEIRRCSQVGFNDAGNREFFGTQTEDGLHGSPVSEHALKHMPCPNACLPLGFLAVTISQQGYWIFRLFGLHSNKAA